MLFVCQTDNAECRSLPGVVVVNFRGDFGMGSMTACPTCGAGVCECLAAFLPAAERIAKARAENPGRSNRFIAEVAGVSPATVDRATPASHEATAPKVGRDGKRYKPWPSEPSFESIARHAAVAAWLAVTAIVSGKRG